MNLDLITIYHRIVLRNFLLHIAPCLSWSPCQLAPTVSRLVNSLPLWPFLSSSFSALQLAPTAVVSHSSIISTAAVRLVFELPVSRLIHLLLPRPSSNWASCSSTRSCQPQIMAANKWQQQCPRRLTRKTSASPQFRNTADHNYARSRRLSVDSYIWNHLWLLRYPGM